MKTQNNHKFTPEIRKQVELLSESLPKIPYLTKNSKGEPVLQMTKMTNMVSGQEIKEKQMADPDLIKKLNATALYSYQQTKMRLMNHKVELTQRFLKDGQYGIDGYVAYVQAMHSTIENMNKTRTVDELDIQQTNEYPLIHVDSEDVISEPLLPENFVGAHSNEGNLPKMERSDFTSDKAYDDYLSNVDENHIPSDLEYSDEEYDNQLDLEKYLKDHDIDEIFNKDTDDTTEQ